MCTPVWPHLPAWVRCDSYGMLPMVGLLGESPRWDSAGADGRALLGMGFRPACPQSSPPARAGTAGSQLSLPLTTSPRRFPQSHDISQGKGPAYLGQPELPENLGKASSACPLSLVVALPQGATPREHPGLLLWNPKPGCALHSGHQRLHILRVGCSETEIFQQHPISILLARDQLSCACVVSILPGIRQHLVPVGCGFPCGAFPAPGTCWTQLSGQCRSQI